MPTWSDGVALNRAGHAVAAASAASQLAAGNGDHLHARLSQKRVAIDVAVVGDHYAGRQRQEIVAVIPLLALRFVTVSAGVDNTQAGYAQSLGYHIDRSFLFSWTQAEAPDGVDDIRKYGDQIGVAESEYRIKMHCPAGFRHLSGDDAVCSSLLEESCSQLAYCLRGRAFSHADKQQAPTERHHVSAFQCGSAVTFVRIAPPFFNLATEQRVEAINGRHQQCFVAACRPIHGTQHHAFV